MAGGILAIAPGVVDAIQEYETSDSHYRRKLLAYYLIVIGLILVVYHKVKA